MTPQDGYRLDFVETFHRLHLVGRSQLHLATGRLPSPWPRAETGAACCQILLWATSTRSSVPGSLSH